MAKAVSINRRSVLKGVAVTAAIPLIDMGDSVAAGLPRRRLGQTV